jgi:hypothetical protein
MDMYNNIILSEEATLNKIMLTPYRDNRFIETLFSSKGLDIFDQYVRIK